MSLQTNPQDNEDGLFLEHVLDQLYDFGSAQNKKLQSEMKKKKRKRCDEEEEEELPVVSDVSSESDGDRADDVSDFHQQQHSKTHQTGPTIQQENRVEVVTFQDPRKKLKTTQTSDSNKPPMPDSKQSSRQEELSLEKARLEVHRFGITGYKKEQQRVFEQDRAVMLGARPPKKEYVNYKVLQQQIKEKKQKAKEEVHPEKKKKKKKQSNQRDKPSPGSSGAPSGQLGRFRNGMLILSSKEIQKLKSHK